MPEENFLEFLRGGVGWGLGLMFARQLDNILDLEVYPFLSISVHHSKHFIPDYLNCVDSKGL